MARTRTLRITGVFAALAVLSGCTAAPAAPTPPQIKSSKIEVVTSIPVWAAIAAEIGGSRFQVRSLIGNLNQDPHGYETTVRDQLAINRADITIENGSGYDTFFHQLVARKPNPAIGMQLTLAPNEGNPHIWFDLNKVTRAAQEIAAAQSQLLPEGTQRLALMERLNRFEAKLAALKRTNCNCSGKSVLITESFAQPLVLSLGLRDATPKALYNAVEEEQDASPKLMDEIRRQILEHKIDLLVVNELTLSAQTTQMIRWAGTAGLPVASMGELPRFGRPYLPWISSNLKKITQGLR